MMKGRFRRSSRRRHRGYSRLMASNWGPILALAATILGALGIIALVVFVGLPKLLPLVGLEYSAPFAPTPSPSPTPRPTPTPHPMTFFDPVDAQTEVVFDVSSEYKWFGDPYFYEGTLVLSAGKLVNNNVAMQDLLFYHPETRTVEKSTLTLKCDHFMFAKFNGKWLVYLDANLDGGGYIMAYDRTDPSSSPVVIKQVYAGQPEPMLDGDYIAWTERTGTRMDKLFVCDLNTRETSVVYMFSNSYYGQSLPSLRDGLLIWADADTKRSPDGEETSAIYSIRLTSSTLSTYSAGTYVHDPEGDGKYTVWLDGHHGPGTRLYCSVDGYAAELIDDNVVEFGLGDGFVAYSKEESIFLYVFDTSSIYRVSPERELTQFLGVSDDRVIWMDVTSRERDIIKFAVIP